MHGRPCDSTAIRPCRMRCSRVWTSGGCGVYAPGGLRRVQSVGVWMCGCVCVRAPVNHTCERVGGCARGSHSNLGCLIEVGRHGRRQADDRGWLRTSAGVCRSDCRMHCLADRVLSQLNTEYQICDTKFIIRVTYTRTW